MLLPAERQAGAEGWRWPHSQGEGIQHMLTQPAAALAPPQSAEVSGSTAQQTPPYLVLTELALSVSGCKRPALLRCNVESGMCAREPLGTISSSAVYISFDYLLFLCP